eukprot:TRINITY_DN4279_c1_g1_i1.p1 TRINITY_DN4279_c1_g1~~TRINITY_DN4279_c1_g1_i1.p1  ORF type:complete len:160 (-),score=9.16 TRINITY_DN4279_c1_g1_i1:204-683(-)
MFGDKKNALPPLSPPARRDTLADPPTRDFESVPSTPGATENPLRKYSLAMQELERQRNRPQETSNPMFRRRLYSSPDADMSADFESTFVASSNGGISKLFVITAIVISNFVTLAITVYSTPSIHKASLPRMDKHLQGLSLHTTLFPAVALFRPLRAVST